MSTCSEERALVGGPGARRWGAAAAIVATALALAACGGHDNDSGSISIAGGRLWGARFAPDGTTLAVAYGPDDKIGTIDLDSGNLSEVTSGASYLTGTAWSPSGDAIYFNGTAGRTAETYPDDVDVTVTWRLVGSTCGCSAVRPACSTTPTTRARGPRPRRGPRRCWWPPRRRRAGSRRRARPPGRARGTR